MAALPAFALEHIFEHRSSAFEHFEQVPRATRTHDDDILCSNPPVVMRADTLLLRLPIVAVTLGLVAVCAFQRWLALKLNREAAERRAFAFRFFEPASVLKN